MKKEIKIYVVFVLSIVLVLFAVVLTITPVVNEINSFESCVSAGNPVLESFPRQCISSEGELFVENILRNYVGYNKEECSKIQVLCTPDREYFSDKTGCGCELKEIGEEKFFCPKESRNVGFCIEIYQPVCGWNDPEKIQCIKFPCASTYSNSCFSCQDENVLYWTEGECPK